MGGYLDRMEQLITAQSDVPYSIVLHPTVFDEMERRGLIVPREGGFHKLTDEAIIELPKYGLDFGAWMALRYADHLVARDSYVT